MSGASVELIPSSYTEPLELEEIFGRSAAVEVDIGCGAGSFIVALAAQNPDRNFLAIERLLGRVRTVRGRAARAGVSNLRVLRIESSYAVRCLLPAESITVFHISFPDPWPKRRHHRRRLINDAFLGDVSRALVPGGQVRLATDDAPYFAQMNSAAAARKDFAVEAWAPHAEYPQTDFERRFRALGTPIHRLLLRKL